MPRMIYAIAFDGFRYMKSRGSNTINRYYNKYRMNGFSLQITHALCVL